MSVGAGTNAIKVTMAAMNIFKSGTRRPQVGVHLVSYNHFHSAKV